MPPLAPPSAVDVRQYNHANRCGDGPQLYNDIARAVVEDAGADAWDSFVFEQVASLHGPTPDRTAQLRAR